MSKTVSVGILDLIELVKKGLELQNRIEGCSYPEGTGCMSRVADMTSDLRTIVGASIMDNMTESKGVQDFESIAVHS